jgi:hypothetical protein
MRRLCMKSSLEMIIGRPFAFVATMRPSEAIFARGAHKYLGMGLDLPNSRVRYLFLRAGWRASARNSSRAVAVY